MNDDDDSEQGDSFCPDTTPPKRISSKQTVGATEEKQGLVNKIRDTPRGVSDVWQGKDLKANDFGRERALSLLTMMGNGRHTMEIGTVGLSVNRHGKDNMGTQLLNRGTANGERRS
jgi:hypothetical protein